MNSKFLYLALIFVAMIQGVILWVDPHPMFFFGDSASYIWTAVAGWLPSDRSFVYGYFVRLVALFTHWLTMLVIVQVAMVCATSLVAAHLLVRYFKVRPWIAFGAALLIAVEPLQLLMARYVMTETLALFIFVFYVWIALHYLEDTRIRWLILLQGVAVTLISIRLAFIPLVWIAALMIPFFAISAKDAYNKSSIRKYASRIAIHAAVSIILLFTFTTAYKNFHGFLHAKPPAYSYDDGFFAIGYVIPFLESHHFHDEGLGRRIIDNPVWPLDDRRNRPMHRWMENGTLNRLQTLLPDRLEANMVARQTALNAVLDRPMDFLHLGWLNFTDYFDARSLRASMKKDMGDRQIEEEFYQLLREHFHYASDRSSALELQSPTGKYFLKSGRWLQFLLFLPVAWLLLWIFAPDSGQRRKILLMLLLSLTLMGVVVFLIELPTPRYLHIPAWLALLSAGVGLDRIWSLRKRKKKIFGKTSPESETASAFYERTPGKTRIGKITCRDDYLFWGLFIGSALLLLWLKHAFFYSPTGATCFGDELIYKRNAANFFEGIRIRSAHYPPLYSLIITPAFLFQNWYDALIRMNGLVSTMLAIPVWFLSREFLDRRVSAVAVLLSLMIPFHLIYPGYILSENLFMPLFALAVLFALKGADGKPFMAGVFGVTLAAGHLTRHLMLPAVFLLSVFWIVLPYITERKESPPVFRALRLNFLIMALCFLVPYSLWLAYITCLDIPAMKAMGFGISGLRAPQQNLPAAIMWLSSYGSYVILAAAPFLLYIVTWGLASASKWRLVPVSKEAAFALLTLALSICYLMVASNHSFSAGYNADSPKYLIGRYLMFLTPLYIVLGLIAMKRLVDKEMPVRRWQIVCSAVLVVAVIFTARWILHEGGIWGLPGWFANIEFNSPDAFVYLSPVMLWIAVLCVMASAGLIWSCKTIIKTRHAKYLSAALITILLVWHALIYVYTADRLPVNLDGLHPRYLAGPLSDKIIRNENSIELFYDIPGLDESSMHRALAFWGVAVKRNELRSVFHNSNAVPQADLFWMLSPHRYQGKEVLSYDVGAKTFYLYEIDRRTILPLKIRQYGPATVRARELFNHQAGDLSAMWLKTLNATSWTRIILNGEEAMTVVENSKTLTAVVPDALFAQPGKIEVRLKDRLTDAESKPVFIDVTP